MKVAARNSILMMSLLALSLVGGCKNKKQQAQVAQPPTITAPDTANPAQPPPTANTGSTTSPNPNTTAQPQPNKTQTAQTQPKPKPKKPKPSAAHKLPPTTEAPADKNATGNGTTANGNTTIAANVPPRITIETDSKDLGGAISATGPHSDDVHDKLSTEQLLQTTEDNLKSIKRALTADEQAQVVQIRNFMAQSRAASTDSDLVRARNLALKAHLLSDELVRHK